MNALRHIDARSLVPLIFAVFALPAGAQVPVDESGAALAAYERFDGATATGNEDIPLLTATELQELVGPIALYPDDLLAVVLPASTYPLQLVQAQRFLDDLEEDPSLTPDDEWDDSVVALLNYPEVVELLNEDLDWTWRLGEAVVAQQADVVAAVEGFRDRAYAAGNLQSDTHQTVSHNEGAIEIRPAEEDVIYVPYYEPERVVVYQPRPVYYYYPRAYPVYYYPYPDTYAFNRGFFWGVTTAFTVGWLTDSVHVVHHSYHGHPYYNRHYWNGWWYRRPSIHVHNNYYSGSRYSVSRHRYTRGDYWRPRHTVRRKLHNQRISRSNYYAGQAAPRRHAQVRSDSGQRRRSTSDRVHRSEFSPAAATRTRHATRASVRTPSTRQRAVPATPRRTSAAGRTTRHLQSDRVRREARQPPRNTRAVPDRRADRPRAERRSAPAPGRESKQRNERRSERKSESRPSERRERGGSRGKTRQHRR